MSKVEAKEGVLTHTVDSPTAASAANRLFPTSGVQTYRVSVVSGNGAHIKHDVEAATGDEAADLALAVYQGGKVAHVAPAPQKAA